MKSFTLNLNITNTFAANKYKYLGFLCGQITNNKFWELEHYLDLHNIFLFKIRVETECNHAGVEITLALAGYNLSFRAYDCRHWNKKERCWEKYQI